jgi:flagellar hook assembly protein FlgD
VTGEPGTYAGALEPARDPIPPGDPVDRAMPTVSVLDSKGEVIRTYPRGEGTGRERQIVWDCRDAEQHDVPPGDYFIRVRYGFTERFGRVTLVR